MVVGFLSVCRSDKNLERGGNGEDDDMFVYAFTSSILVPFHSSKRVPAASVAENEE